jgi:hypothetical protein
MALLHSQCFRRHGRGLRHGPPFITPQAPPLPRRLRRDATHRRGQHAMQAPSVTLTGGPPRMSVRAPRPPPATRRQATGQRLLSSMVDRRRSTENYRRAGESGCGCTDGGDRDARLRACHGPQTATRVGPSAVKRWSGRTRTFYTIDPQKGRFLTAFASVLLYGRADATFDAAIPVPAGLSRMPRRLAPPGATARCIFTGPGNIVHRAPPGGRPLHRDRGLASMGVTACKHLRRDRAAGTGASGAFAA